MRLYFDLCCLNRPFDDHSHERIRVESEAILSMLERCVAGVHQWISSTSLEEEAARNPDLDRRLAIQDMLAEADEELLVGDLVLKRVQEYRTQGLRGFDAVYLALAEIAGCDILFTVDDDLIRRARQLKPPLTVKVENPARWVLLGEQP